MRFEHAPCRELSAGDAVDRSRASVTTARSPSIRYADLAHGNRQQWITSQALR
jgi:hypothetical protein